MRVHFRGTTWKPAALSFFLSFFWSLSVLYHLGIFMPANAIWFILNLGQVFPAPPSFMSHIWNKQDTKCFCWPEGKKVLLQNRTLVFVFFGFFFSSSLLSTWFWANLVLRFLSNSCETLLVPITTREQRTTLYFLAKSSISKTSNLPTDMPVGLLWLLLLRKLWRKPKMHFPSSIVQLFLWFFSLPACVCALPVMLFWSYSRGLPGEEMCSPFHRRRDI